MISKDFNNGWGQLVELRQFELSLLERYLGSWFRDDKKNVLINSTWYDEIFHAKIIDYISRNHVDRMALISLVDPAIVKPAWFQQFDIEIRCVGYYRGPDELDAWALIIDRYFEMPVMIDTKPMLDIPFLCYNRKPHWHRKKLVAEMAATSCVDLGIVTLGHESGKAQRPPASHVVAASIAPNSGREHYGIENDIMSLGPSHVWDRCFLNVVTETVFDVDKNWFVSEKIYKPIIGLRPFLVYAPNGARAWLTHCDLQDFTQDFKDICALDLTIPESIAPFLSVLSNQSQAYFNHKYQELVGKIQYNYHQFKNYVQSIKQNIADLGMESS